MTASLDAVEKITGVRVRERVPDWVDRSAEQIDLLAPSPDELRRRLIRGEVYAPDQVAEALANFSSTDRLVALGELAARPSWPVVPVMSARGKTTFETNSLSINRLLDGCV